MYVVFFGIQTEWGNKGYNGIRFFDTEEDAVRFVNERQSEVPSRYAPHDGEQGREGVYCILHEMKDGYTVIDGEVYCNEILVSPVLSFYEYPQEEGV